MNGGKLANGLLGDINLFRERRVAGFIALQCLHSHQLYYFISFNFHLFIVHNNSSDFFIHLLVRLRLPTAEREREHHKPPPLARTHCCHPFSAGSWRMASCHERIGKPTRKWIRINAIDDISSLASRNFQSVDKMDLPCRLDSRGFISHSSPFLLRSFSP